MSYLICMNYGKKNPQPEPPAPQGYANQWIEVDLTSSYIDELGYPQIRILFKKPTSIIKVSAFYNNADHQYEGLYENVIAGQEEIFSPKETVAEIKELSNQLFLHFYLEDISDPDITNHLHVPIWQIPGYNDV